METESQTDLAASSPAPMAALWRRYLGFLIDWIILSLGGVIVGLVLFDPLVRLGPWARVIGFVIATVYFGVGDSGWGGAGSPGKKVLGMRVVDASGRVIGLGRSLLRAALLCAPVILNSIFVHRPGEWGLLALDGLTGGWLVATLYVLVFNRGTKQGLHDLATGTFVVHGRATRMGLGGYTFWRPHLIIATVCVALSVPAALAGLPVYMHFAPGLNHEVTTAPDTGPVEVVNAKLKWDLKKKGDSGRPECLSALFQLRGTGVLDEHLARTLSMQMIAHYRCQVVTSLTVRMQYGFDMGFSSGTAFHDFVIDEADLTRSP
ncbi:RDD family protein [Luteibacter aegosomatissinici]|uniref:RDD family protein n=1 Tax=Luteibacter aegosomatissinici TaxID=2911539 RepID=UPI001FFBA774|nr:RDD family protein [Luteibacter aegosomatissinici]UPG93313.1 RDD family protein [Luteibacter aegosomatissinici]